MGAGGMMVSGAGAAGDAGETDPPLVLSLRRMS
jgi:hypothetical protein